MTAPPQPSLPVPAAIAFGIKQGVAMQTILDIVNVSTGRNTATEDKFPRRIMMRIRCRIHGQNYS